MRTAVYTRISQDRTGESLGVQRQREDCEALAERLGWTVTARYDDNDRSATTGKARPGFEALLDAMKRGEVDGVIAWHPDRLYRRLSDLTRLLDVAKGIEFRTVTAGELDLSTPTGRMVASILGSVATAEVEHKGERQRRAAQQLAESGKPKWRRAFGYLDAGGDRRELDPKLAPLIAQAYRDVIAGASISDVARVWNDAGALTLNGRPWTAPQVSAFLRKPRNAALRSYQAPRGAADRDSIIGPAAWPAIIDAETFWAAQRILEGRFRPGPKSVQRHLLTGLLRCGRCGSHLSGKWAYQRTGGTPGRPKAGEVKQHPGIVSHVIVYSCKECRGCSIRAERIEPRIQELVIDRLSRPDARDLLKAEQHDTAESELIRAELTALYSKLDTIGIERADELLTGRQAKIATDRIQAKIDALESRLHDADRARVFDGIPLGTEQVETAILGLSPDRFRAVLDALVTVTIEPVGKRGNTFDPSRIKTEWKQ